MVFGHKIPVVLRTTAGDEVREFAPHLRLIEVCRLLRVPPNAISTFATGSTSTRRVVGLYEQLGRLVRSDGEQLVLQFDRNLNYNALLSDARSTTQNTRSPITESALSAS
jgi:hypothetical protein